jgi:hypothetical protein
MYIPDKSDFMPSREALAKWLSTRKSNLNVGGVLMPQFFSDNGNSSDSNWFIIACIGELLGFGTTIYGGMRSGGIFMIFATLCIIMFIFCDFFFAIKLHRNKARNCMIETYKLQLNDSQSILWYDNQINKTGRFTDFMLQTGIILIGFFKVVGIVLLGVFNNLVLYVPFAIIYFIVAYVHLKHTGYWFAYKATENNIHKDYNNFSKGINKAIEKNSPPVITTSPLNNMPVKYNPHEIIKNPESSDENNYIIKYKGVLTDEDIQNLIAGQTDLNKITLFKAARKIQTEFVEFVVPKKEVIK